MNRAPLYENMKFKPYEYHEYPKLIEVPIDAQAQFSHRFIDSGNILKTVHGEPAMENYSAKIKHLQVESKEDEEDVLAKINKIMKPGKETPAKAPAPTTPV